MSWVLENKERPVLSAQVSTASWVVFLLVVLCGCSSVTKEDLVELGSTNAIVKQRAIERVSKPPVFFVDLIRRGRVGENEKKAVDILVQLISSDRESKETQLCALRALGELGRRTKVPWEPLVRQLERDDREIRVQTIEALGKARCKRAVQILSNLVQKKPVSYTAIWALGEIGDPSTVSTLNSLLANDDEYVRFNAYKALQKIGKTGPKCSGRHATTAFLNIRNMVDGIALGLKKYQDMLTCIFQKISELKN